VNEKILAEELKGLLAEDFDFDIGLIGFSKTARACSCRNRGRGECRVQG
jgi:hypothetical protein